VEHGAQDQPDQERVEQFKQEINDMGLRPATSRDRTMLRLGALACCWARHRHRGYFMSTPTNPC
jgi:hypothetical protein